MRRVFLPFGWLLCAAGAALIAASLVMTQRGLAASYNFGDPAKFEFILVPFWQIGLAIVAAGIVCLLASRWLKTARG